MRLSQKHDVVESLNDKVVAKAYAINVAFGYEKKIRPDGPSKKIILLQFCPKKYFGPDLKPKPPPPLNIKWIVP